MFVGTFVLQVLLDEFGSGAVRIPSIEYVKQNIRTINNLVQLLPNTLGTTFKENGVFHQFLIDDHVILVVILIIRWVVLLDLLISLLHHLI